MVIKDPQKQQQQFVQDKMLVSMKDANLDDDDEDRDDDDDDDDDEDKDEDDVLDKDLIRIIRKHHTKNNFFRWLPKRIRHSS